MHSEQTPRDFNTTFALIKPRGLQTFLSEEHISNYTTIRGPDMLTNVNFAGYVHSTKSTSFS